jgi:hypothetical protein
MIRKVLLGVLLVVSFTLIGIGVFQLLPARQDTSPSVMVVEEKPDASQDVARISVETLHAKLQGDNAPLVWELRLAERYAKAHLPGSLLVEESEVEALAADLDRGQAIVTLCA